MKKTFSFGILAIGLMMLAGMLRTKQEHHRKDFTPVKNTVFDSINDDPIGI
jgi:hypothetical protein